MSFPIWQERKVTIIPGQVLALNLTNGDANAVQIINRKAVGGGNVYFDNEPNPSSSQYAAKVEQGNAGSIVRPYALKTIYLMTDAADPLTITVIEIAAPNLNIVFNASQLLSIQGKVEVAEPVTIDGTVNVGGEVEIKNDSGNPVPISGNVEIANDAGNPIPVSGTVSVNEPVTVDGTISVGNFPTEETTDWIVQDSSFESEASTTQIGQSGSNHYVTGIMVSYSGAPSPAGELILQENGIDILNQYVDGSERTFLFPKPIKIATGQSVTLRLMTGGTGVTGRVSLLGYTK